jgi:ABC-type multidrug transport system ATPase subunit
VLKVEVENLNKRYRGYRVDEASFAVEEGQIFGTAGPNDTGETTPVEGVKARAPPLGACVQR